MRVLSSKAFNPRPRLAPGELVAVNADLMSLTGKTEQSGPNQPGPIQAYFKPISSKAKLGFQREIQENSIRNNNKMQHTQQDQLKQLTIQWAKEVKIDVRSSRGYKADVNGQPMQLIQSQNPKELLERH